MNEFDDTTFARFARRFAHIEQLVPEPPTRVFPPMTRVQPNLARLLRPAILLGAVLLLGGAFVFAAGGLQPGPTPTPSPTVAPSPRVTIPPDSAPREVVLDAYLSALVAGDCDTAGQFVGSPVYDWGGDAFCGGVTHVVGFRILGDSTWLAMNQVMVETALTTTGFTTGMQLPAGDYSFFFDLQQQSSGAWRVVQAHPGAPLFPFALPTFPIAPPT
jgi:hypothetical protein